MANVNLRGDLNRPLTNAEMDANFINLNEDLATKESAITAAPTAATAKYWRGDKTWSDFFTNVRAATLTGLRTATTTMVFATDTVLAAIGKLQAQMSVKFDTTGGDISGAVTVSGNLLATGGVLGYGVGAGGTTQQSDSVTAPVFLNTPNGVITLMNDFISAGGRIEFALYNSLITADSIVIAHGVFDWTGPSIKQLTVRVEYVQFGQAIISVKNIHNNAVFTNDVKIRFAVFAGSNS